MEIRTVKSKPSSELGSFSILNVVVIAAVLLGTALRAIRLDFQPLWWDEGYSVFFATRDVPTLLARTAVDIHPPLYYILLQLWIDAFGTDQIALRLLSVTIGVAVIPLFYAISRRLFGSHVATIAVFLVALSPFQIYYSQEIRMYGLVTLLGLGSVYLWIQLLATPPGKPKTAAIAVAYVLVTVAALYTEYYAALLVAFEIVFVIVTHFRKTDGAERRSELGHWLTAWAATALLYLPWVIYAGYELYRYVAAKVVHEAYGALDPFTFLTQYLTAFSVGHLTAFLWLRWASVIFIALALFGAFMSSRKPRFESSKHLVSPTLLAILYVAIPIILAYAINVLFPFNPIRVERLLLVASPGFLMLVALGIFCLFEQRRAAGLLAVLTLAALSSASLWDFFATARYPNDDYRPLIAEIQSLAQPGDAYVAVYPWQIGYLKTYYSGAPLSITEVPSNSWVNDQGALQRDVDALRVQHGRIWFPAFQLFGRILEDRLEAYLRPRDYAVVDTWYGSTRLELFTVAPDPAQADHMLPLPISSTSVPFGISERDVVSGQGTIPMWFEWGELAGAQNKVSIRLQDSSRNVWAQQDLALDTGRQRIGFPVPVGTPPGRYALSLTLYTGNGSARAPADAGKIGQVQVISPSMPNYAALPRAGQLDFGNGMRLADVEWPAAIKPGEPSAITLFWQAARPIGVDYDLQLEVQDARGTLFDRVQSVIARGIYPSSQWRPNELVRDPQTLSLRGDTPNGTYSLVATIYQPGNEATRSTKTIGTIRVQARPHYFGVPSPSSKTAYRFGNTARLVGYDLRQSPQGFELVLYWQSINQAQPSYTVFAHVLDAADAIVGQHDQIPGDGAFPTSTWVKDEYLVDEYSIAADTSAARAVEIGLYDPETGARLPAFDAQDNPLGERVLLPIR